MKNNWDQYKVNTKEPENSSEISKWDQYKIEKNNPSINDKVVGSLLKPEDALGITKDILSGIATSGQNVVNTVAGGHGTDINFTKELKAPGNPLFHAVGQYALAAPIAGESILAQMLSGGVYNALQSPDHPIMGGAIGALVPPVIKGAGILPKIPQAIGNLKQSIGTLFKRLDPEGLVSLVQKGHDKAFQQASDLYNFVKNEVNNRGIKNINVNDKLIDKAEGYLPKTDSNEALIAKARTGDYEAVHNLQSDLGKRGFKLKAHDLSSESDKGEEMLDLRDKINRSTSNTFKDLGHEDLSKLLDEARNKFSKMKDTYYSHNSIAKMVNPSTRKIPKNPINIFSEKSVQMDKLIKKHPEIQEAIDLKKEKDKLKPILKYSGIGASAFAGGALEEYVRHLFNK